MSKTHTLSALTAENGRLVLVLTVRWRPREAYAPPPPPSDSTGSFGFGTNELSIPFLTSTRNTLSFELLLK